MAEFVSDSHRAMVGSSGSGCDRTMNIARAEGGFTLDAFFFEGSNSASFLFDLIRLRIVTAFVELRPDLIWIHSGVVARPEGALLIVGASGQGKSTFVTHLCELGWQFLSDEMAPIDIRQGSVVPYPRSPLRRVNPGHNVGPQGIGELEKVGYAVPADRIAMASVPIRAIVFPRFSHSSETVIEKLSAGESSLELMRSCTNFPDHKAEAVTALARIATLAPCRRVMYGDGNDAANVLHRLNDGLFQSS